VTRLSTLFLGALLCALPFAAPGQSDPFVSMAQVSRSDGLKLFVLTGTYRDRAKCEKLGRELVDKTLVQAWPQGMTAEIDFLSCDTKAPAGSEFAAMRGEAPARRIIFLAENLRAVPVPPRGGRAEERKVCEQIQQRVLTRIGVSGECLSPGE
jgi:hypothetical protein